MTALSDRPTRMLTNLYRIVWLATIGLLTAAGVVYLLMRHSGTADSPYSYLQQLLVQVYLLLIPAAIFVFAVLMTIARKWALSLTSYVLTLIWIGAKLLG